MMQNMQKPIYYHGFDVAIMDLRTFIGVSRSLSIVGKLYDLFWNYTTFFIYPLWSLVWKFLSDIIKMWFLFLALQKGRHLLHDV